MGEFIEKMRFKNISKRDTFRAISTQILSKKRALKMSPAIFNFAA
jgi:hypothetical protein